MSSTQSPDLSSEQMIKSIHERHMLHEALKEELIQVKEFVNQGAVSILNLKVSGVSDLISSETNPSFVLVSKNSDFLLKSLDRREFFLNEEVAAILLNTQGNMEIHVSYQKPQASVEEKAEDIVTEKPEVIESEIIEKEQHQDDLSIEAIPELALFHASIPLSTFQDVPDDAVELPTVTIEAQGQDGETITLTLTYEQDPISKYIVNISNELKILADKLTEDSTELKLKVLQERASVHVTSSNYTQEEEDKALQQEQELLIKQASHDVNEEEEDYEDIEESVKKSTKSEKKVKGKGKSKGGKIIKKKSKKSSPMSDLSTSFTQSVSLVRDVLVNNKEAFIFVAASTLAYFYGEAFSV